MASKQEPMEVDSPSKSSKQSQKDAKTVETPAEKPPLSQADIDLLTFEDLKEHCRLIERGESTKEPRFLSRILRSLVTTRKRINNNVLWKLVNHYLSAPVMSKQKEMLLSFLTQPVEPMEVDTITKDTKAPTLATLSTTPSTMPKSPRQQQQRKAASGIGLSALAQQQPLLPEIEAYLYLLTTLYLLDQKRLEDADKCITVLLKRLEGQNRRSLDALSAKSYYFYALISEKRGQLSSIIDFLHARLRTATLRHDEDSQATIINCLLRAYLQNHMYDLAAKLDTKARFPESANNNEWARYQYYLGRINAMKLEYSLAQKHLQQALRKAPQHSAPGFKQTAQKLLVVVDLLLGDIPERSLFRQPIFRKALQPYMQLTQAVRMGSVQKFNEVVSTFARTFEADGTLSLIVRLRQNVIKTAIKQISTAYSKISLPDIQKKLHLTQKDDAEYVVSKAIKDGVIEATLSHEEDYMQSKETADVYSTTEPQHQFHTRIGFCLEIYKQAMKAMRFPPQSYNKDLETAEDKREREQQELEFAKEMAEEDDDFP